MRYHALALLIIVAAVVGVQAGDPALAARQLGHGIKLLSSSSSGKLSAADAKSSGLLNFEPSTADLCPVVAYGVDVLPVTEPEALLLLGASGAAKLAAAKQLAGDKPDAKAFKLVLTPLSYVQNNSIPAVDWVDAHFKVADGPQSSVQMKSVGGSEMKMEHMMTSTMGGQWIHAPIYLSKSDVLTFAFTLCSNMVDCNTVVHTFQQEKAEAEAKAEAEGEAKRRSMPKQKTEAVHKAEQPSAEPSAQPKQMQPPMKKEEQALKKEQQKKGEQVAAEAGGCPAIAYTYRIDCGDTECKASFVNLTPEKPLDWVDIHVVKTDESRLQALMARSVAEGPLLASALADAALAELPQQNFQMSLGAGVAGSMAMDMSKDMSATMHGESMSAMHETSSSMPKMSDDSSSMMSSEHSDKSMKMMHSMQPDAVLSSPLHQQKFGLSSLPNKLLAESGGSQVFQFPIPLQLKHADMIGLSFTYCANGTDCDTELSFWRLEDDAITQQQQQPNQQQQHQLAHSLSSRAMPIPRPQTQAHSMLERDL